MPINSRRSARAMRFAACACAALLCKSAQASRDNSLTVAGARDSLGFRARVNRIAADLYRHRRHANRLELRVSRQSAHWIVTGAIASVPFVNAAQRHSSRHQTAPAVADRQQTVPVDVKPFSLEGALRRARAIRNVLWTMALATALVIGEEGTCKQVQSVFNNFSWMIDLSAMRTAWRLDFRKPHLLQLFFSLLRHDSLDHLCGNLSGLLLVALTTPRQWHSTGFGLFWVCGTVGSIAEWLPAADSGVSQGASVAVFGLFVMALIAKKAQWLRSPKSRSKVTAAEIAALGSTLVWGFVGGSSAVQSNLTGLFLIIASLVLPSVNWQAVKPYLNRALPSEFQALNKHYTTQPLKLWTLTAYSLGTLFASAKAIVSRRRYGDQRQTAERDTDGLHALGVLIGVAALGIHTILSERVLQIVSSTFKEGEATVRRVFVRMLYGFALAQCGVWFIVDHYRTVQARVDVTVAVCAFSLAVACPMVPGVNAAIESEGAGSSSASQVLVA